MSEVDLIVLFSQLLEKKFLAAIERKTGWGKNEIETEFIQAERDALLELTSSVTLSIKEGE
jgi:hypothetical protein